MACPRDMDYLTTQENVSKEEFGENYDGIIKVIAKNKLDGKAILDTPREDLCEMLKSANVNEEGKNKFFKMRVALQKDDFKQREELDLKNIKINSLTCNQVCQLMEEQVEPRSEKQRQKWYEYIEHESIDGKALAVIQINDLSKNLDLNKGQQAKFNELMDKIQSKPKLQGGMNVHNTGSTITEQYTVMGNSVNFNKDAKK